MKRAPAHIGAVVTWAAAVALAGALAGCACDGKVSVSEKDAGDGVTLAVGQQMEIALASNPTTGYSWQVADDAGGILSMVGEPTYSQDPAPVGMTGVGGTETLTFEAEKAGEGTLTLEYRRPWKNGGPAIKTLEVPVKVR